MNDNDWQNNTTYQWQDYTSQCNDTASAWQSSASESYTKSYTDNDYWDDKRRREILYPTQGYIAPIFQDNTPKVNNGFTNNLLNEKLSLKARKIIVYGGWIFVLSVGALSIIGQYIFKLING